MTAVDKETFNLINMNVVSDRTQQTFDDFIDSISLNNNLQVSNYHTDAAKQYTEYFKNNSHLNHKKTKDKTSSVESFNSIFKRIYCSSCKKN